MFSSPRPRLASCSAGLSARVIDLLGANRVLCLSIDRVVRALMIPASVSHAPWLIVGAFLIQGISLVAGRALDRPPT